MEHVDDDVREEAVLGQVIARYNTIEQALRQAVLLFEPTLDVTTLSFQEVIERLQIHCADDLAQVPSPQGDADVPTHGS